ncbi:hypothetical protein BKA63DRAFT_498730 [Paraphoma chrysanthemicola]|nr:hypothetical protein BKA63DRAFT_498730 [Paraphoma chrysanthemicola]
MISPVSRRGVFSVSTVVGMVGSCTRATSRLLNARPKLRHTSVGMHSLLLLDVSSRASQESMHRANCNSNGKGVFRAMSFLIGTMGERHCAHVAAWPRELVNDHLNEWQTPASIGLTGCLICAANQFLVLSDLTLTPAYDFKYPATFGPSEG